jgi:hypothetical protein
MRPILAATGRDKRVLNDELDAAAVQIWYQDSVRMKEKDIDRRRLLHNSWERVGQIAKIVNLDPTSVMFKGLARPTAHPKHQRIRDLRVLAPKSERRQRSSAASFSQSAASFSQSKGTNCPSWSLPLRLTIADYAHH